MDYIKLFVWKKNDFGSELFSDGNFGKCLELPTNQLDIGKANSDESGNVRSTSALCHHRPRGKAVLRFRDGAHSSVASVPMKLLLVALCVVSALTRPPVLHLDGPYCHYCEVIINDIKYQFHNNFTGVSVNQLRLALYRECDENFTGFTDVECHQTVDKDVDKTLALLKNGTSAYRVCEQNQLC
ncbi:unnamed protein product [Caenorhabditis auriculariae]|uniref:Saposin B-type domain-containing protein n=1 Tax=Caenorhabditis auriculariae TaxID=2777116 RepID=A0A8S1GQX5_9PELO|nr:unnamed protein product [Caenorhabditis auriculariae]